MKYLVHLKNIESPGKWHTLISRQIDMHSKYKLLWSSISMSISKMDWCTARRSKYILGIFCDVGGWLDIYTYQMWYISLVVLALNCTCCVEILLSAVNWLEANVSVILGCWPVDEVLNIDTPSATSGVPYFTTPQILASARDLKIYEVINIHSPFLLLLPVDNDIWYFSTWETWALARALKFEKLMK